eukprot:scaffold99572_cov22-Cyclotella_meneghiniana.AAC.3
MTPPAHPRIASKLSPSRPSLALVVSSVAQRRCVNLVSFFSFLAVGLDESKTTPVSRLLDDD